VTKERGPPPGRLEPSFEDTPIDERPAIEVVVDVACENEPVDERSVEEQLLEPLQRPEPDQIAATDANEVLADMKMPILLCRVDIADNLDLARMSDAKPVFVGEPHG